MSDKSFLIESCSRINETDVSQGSGIRLVLRRVAEEAR